MHILVLTLWYKSANNPSAGSFIEEQARILQECGHQVSVFHSFVAGTFIHPLKGAKSATHLFNDQGMESLLYKSKTPITRSAV